VNNPFDVAVDLANNELLAVNFNGLSVTAYTRTATSNIAPLRTISGGSTGLNGPVAIAVTPRSRAVDRDFNGDGKTDFIWRSNVSGTVAIWPMNGASVLESAVLGVVGSDWSIEAVADFNGDGKADVLWRNSSSGLLTIWLMNGVAIATSAVVSTVTLDWSVERVGDLNGDGRADIVWRHASGTVSVWFMEGVKVVASASPGGVASEWELQ
jgi:hypothetical protein